MLFNVPRVYFLHIPKTGGTTIDDLLRENFPPALICPERGMALNFLPAAEIQRYWLFSAHACYDFIEAIPKPNRIFTVLRDPIPRSISEYRYWKSIKWAEIDKHRIPQPLVAKSLLLPEYLSWQNMYFRENIKNSQCAQLCGHRYLNPKGIPWRSDQEILDVGFERLSSMTFGLSEFMHASMALVGQSLGLELPTSVPRLNVGPSEALTLDRPSLDELEALNHLDIQLYEFARKTFLSNPANRTFAVSGFTSSFPQDVRSGDRNARLRAPAGAAGYAMFGPYIVLGAGNYTCTFDIELVRPDGIPPDTKIAAIEAFATRNPGQAPVAASRNLLAGDFVGTIGSFSLPFSLLEDCDKLEFRVLTTGAVALTVKAEVTIERSAD